MFLISSSVCAAGAGRVSVSHDPFEVARSLLSVNPFAPCSEAAV